MRRYWWIVGLAAGLSLLVVLSGCAGLPGAGGAGAQQQQTPPGVLPPPGLESGGVRTLMGTTVTPQTGTVLLVSFTTNPAGTQPSGTWQSVRRVTVTDAAVFLEGLNYNGREEGQPQDVNRLIPLAQVTSLNWRYEGQPTTEAKPGQTPGAKPAGPGQPAKPSGRGR